VHITLGCFQSSIIFTVKLAISRCFVHRAKVTSVDQQLKQVGVSFTQLRAHEADAFNTLYMSWRHLSRIQVAWQCLAT
jgi:hypothetical protein